MPKPAIELHSVQSDWQSCLRAAYRDPLQLLHDLNIDPKQIDWMDAKGFGMLVPRGFAARMQQGNPQDPLLLQVLPRRRELHAAEGYSADPVEESQFHQTPGLIHKYHGRALIIATAACGVHCRYCFRREFDYRDAREGSDGWQSAVLALATQTDVHEVILSGGDPLSLSDDKFARLLQELEAIPHIQRLRVHSRQPVVLPQRITPQLLNMLQKSRLNCVMVIHSNHAQEIDDQVSNACQALKENAVTLFNQSVLLAGVNDSAEALADLSEALFLAGVLPYYLHQLDPVIGAAHFQLTDHAARGIMRDLNGRLPGYLVPKLVREIPGRTGKIPISWGEE
ncbi:MAG: EF-P beta-lysylation protein EpmB [Oceanococcus sp.]